MEKIENTPVEISDYPVRRRKILRTYDFILPKFYFGPPWGNFVSSLTLPDFLPRSQIRRVTPCRDARKCLAGGRPLCKARPRQGFNGDGRLPLNTHRASLQPLHVPSVTIMVTRPIALIAPTPPIAPISSPLISTPACQVKKFLYLCPRYTYCG